MTFLAFLADPWFVVPWYIVGALCAAWMYRDLRTVNTPLKQAIKWGWPIIAFFFSVVGLGLYFLTARAPGIQHASSEDEKKKLHAQYQSAMWRRVNGAVIHCVAGDGLGIMTAMVIARIVQLTFWQEFWFEYAVGFAFGWFIFQLKAMKMMTDSLGKALAMAFRAEFFSMLTVMGGMGAVMAYLTPMVVGAQPKPDTAAFWGFGMLGLMVGYVFTFPMNWMLVKIGWKHGMGPKEGAKPVQTGGAKTGLGLAMVVLGAIAMGIPALLAVQRESEQGRLLAASAAGSGEASIGQGMQRDVNLAREALQSGNLRLAASALDGAMRLGEVGKAAQMPEAESALRQIKQARTALQDHRTARALAVLAQGNELHGRAPSGQANGNSPRADTPVVNVSGAVIGEVKQASGSKVQLALGGARDVLGFWDGTPKQSTEVDAKDLVIGPQRLVGKSYVMLRTSEIPPVSQVASSQH